MNLVITGLPPGWTTMLAAESSMPRARADVGRQGLAQWCDPGRRAVAGLALGDRPVHRLDDVGRRRQVDVAEMERVDAIAACRPVGRSRRYRERRLGAEPAKSFCELHALPCVPCELAREPQREATRSCSTMQNRSAS